MAVTQSPGAEMPRPTQSIQRQTVLRYALSWWECVVRALFSVLCLRFIVATALEAASSQNLPTMIVLGLGVLALALLQSEWALFAFLCAVPALNGIGLLGLTGTVEPLPFAFSCAMIGLLLNQLRRQVNGGGGLLRNFSEHGNPGGSGTLWGGVVVGRAIALFLMTAILLSFAKQLTLWGCSDRAFWTQATFGWADGRYFVTSAFIWLSGLYVFLECSSKVTWLNRSWKVLLVSWAVAILVFFSIQYWLQMPEPLVLWPYQGRSFSHGYSAPFDDMHSFGSILVCLLGVFLWLVEWRRGPRLLALACFSTLLMMIILSYGRANWVVGACLIFAWAARRLPKWATLGMIVIVAVSVVWINFETTQSAWVGQSYRYRLYSLVRLEAPTVKLSSRLFMFHKAREAIETHPIAGLGIGEFYSHSPQYALDGDPLAQKMDFAHDMFLQFTSEIGVPCGLLLAILILHALWPGFRGSALGCPQGRLRLGLAIGICGYLATQLTAHALNIYFSNQMLIWALIGIVAAGRREGPEANER